MRCFKPLFVIALAATVAGASSCTLIHDETATQCRSEEDCRSRGPEWADTTCTEQRVCVKLTEEAKLCSTNQECSDKNGGAAFRCLPKTRQCAPITTADCPKIFGEKQDYLNDNAIYVGLGYPNDVLGLFIESAIELGRSEIRLGFGGGLPPAQAGGPKRPLVVLGCPFDPTGTVGSVQSVEAGSRHLINDLNIPAFIGPITGPGIQAANAPILVANNVSNFIVSNASTTYLQPHPLTFMMHAYQEATANLIPPFITEYLEPKVRTDFTLPLPAQLRIQIVASEDASTRLVTEYLTTNMKWNNGLNTVDNGANYKFTTLGDTQDVVETPDTQAKFATAVAEVRDFKPHILIFSAPPTVQMQSFIPAVEAAWQGPDPRPFWVMTLGAWGAFLVPIINSLPFPERDPLRKRCYGVQGDSPQRDLKRLDKFNIDLRTKFSQLVPMRNNMPSVVAYDTLWAIAYAIIAAGPSEITGDVIARSTKRLSSGVPIGIGTADTAKGAQELGKGAPILLRMINGPWAPNEKNEMAWNASIFCAAGLNGNALFIQNTDYQYDPRTGKTTGPQSLVCP